MWDYYKINLKLPLLITPWYWANIIEGHSYVIYYTLGELVIQIDKWNSNYLKNQDY